MLLTVLHASLHFLLAKMYGGPESSADCEERKHLHQFDITCAAVRNTETRCTCTSCSVLSTQAHRENGFVISNLNLAHLVARSLPDFKNNTPESAQVHPSKSGCQDWLKDSLTTANWSYSHPKSAQVHTLKT